MPRKKPGGVTHIKGGSRSDFLMGTNRDDVMDGGRGNDLMMGRRGDDTMLGGRGNDFMSAGRGRDWLDGGAGHDMVFAGDDDDHAFGGDGDDWVHGGNGNDVLYGGAGDDWVHGGNGRDILYGGRGSDLVDGSSGNDKGVYVRAENARARDHYDGGSGVDTLRLELTGAEWQRQDVKDDVARYLDFLADHVRRNGQADNASFEFESMGLTAQRWEKLEVVVDGVVIDPTVQPVDHPVVAVDDSAATLEDEAISGNVLGNDSVPDQVGSLTVKTGPQNGTLSLDAAGNFVYTPFADFSGSDSFEYLLTDADGDSAAATVSLTIAAVADSPALQVNDAAGQAGAAIELAIFTALTDTDGSESLGPVTISGVPQDAILSAGVDLGNGVWSLTPDQLGGLTITPSSDGDFVLTVTTRSTEADGNAGAFAAGGVAESSAQIALSVEPAEPGGGNQAPVAVDDNAVTTQGEAISLWSFLLLENDFDPDGDSLQLIDFGNAVNGLVMSDDGGNPYFEPDPGFTGVASFEYTIGDGNGGTDTATVTITVEPAEQAIALLGVSPGSDPLL